MVNVFFKSQSINHYNRILLLLIFSSFTLIPIFGQNVSGEKEYKKATKIYEKATFSGQYKGKVKRIGKFNQEAEIDKAIIWYEKSAKKGYLLAMIKLGHLYEYREKFDLALKWYNEVVSIDNNYTSTRNVLCGEIGKIYLDRKSYKEAFEWYQIGANYGDAHSQWMLALCYLEGIGVEQNSVESIKWFNKAKEQGYRLEWIQKYLSEIEKYGDAFLHFKMAENYKQGMNGYEKNEKEAIKWLELSAHKKYPPAMSELGRVKKHEESAKWYLKAAENGEKEAYFYVGSNYQYGNKGMKKDYKEAIKWYKKYAESSNYGLAERCIGEIYESGGYGVDKNIREAAVWYRKAADKGDKEAEYLLGKCYELGNGVVKSSTEALVWFKKAQQHGHPEAAKRIAELTKPATVAKAPTNTTPKNVTPRNTAPRNDVAYLDVLRQYEGRSRIPDLGPYVRSERDEHSTQVIYRFYNEKGWQKYVAIGKCVYCHGSGKCSGFHFGFCTLCGNSGKCRYCGGNGTSLRIAAYGPNGFYSEDGIYHPSNSGSPNVSVPSSGGGFSGGSSSNRSSSSSVYTKCNTCNGTGVCKYCHGKCGEWTDVGTYTGTNTKKWINCVSCNGSGKCSICYGRGKL